MTPDIIFCYLSKKLYQQTTAPYNTTAPNNFSYFIMPILFAIFDKLSLRPFTCSKVLVRSIS